MTKEDLIKKIQGQIKSLLSKEQKFVEVKAGDLMISSPDEELIIGSEVFVLDVDGNNIPLTDGEYLLDTGVKITVIGGKITELSKEDETTDDTSSLELSDEIKLKDTPIVDEVEKDQVMTRLQALEDKVEEMTKKYNEIVVEKEEMRKEFNKFSEQPSTVKIENRPTEFKIVDDKNLPELDMSEIRKIARKNNR